MKTKLILLFLLAATFLASGQAITGYYLTKAQAIGIAKEDFEGKDYDYYLQTDATSLFLCRGLLSDIPVKINASALRSGVHAVALSVDDEIIDSKKFVKQ